MMRQYMTQDRLGKIFFAETNRDKLEILSLTLDEEKLQKTRVFIGTYELAALNADNALGFKEEDQSGIFILSYDGKMHHLKKSQSDKEEYDTIQVYDLPYKNQDKCAWNSMCLGKGVMTQDENLYNGQGIQKQKSKASERSFVWT